jgi:hypothetical protein
MVFKNAKRLFHTKISLADIGLPIIRDLEIKSMTIFEENPETEFEISVHDLYLGIEEGRVILRGDEVGKYIQELMGPTTWKDLKDFKYKIIPEVEEEFKLVYTSEGCNYSYVPEDLPEYFKLELLEWEELLTNRYLFGDRYDLFVLHVILSKEGKFEGQRLYVKDVVNKRLEDIA